MTHYFVIDFCERYRVNTNAAILLSNICYWCAMNKKNGKNFINGKYWMYNSLEAFAAQYPYMSVNQIRYAFKILKKTGAVDCANHNPNEFDRTLWYTPSEEAMRIYLHSYNKNKSEECQDKNDEPKETEIPYDNPDEKEKLPHGNGNFHTSICENCQIYIPDNKPINKPNSSSSEIRQIFCRIHGSLVYDDDFYQKAEVFIRQKSLDPQQYIRWLYHFALKKSARDPRSYLYSLFFRDEIVGQYLHDRAEIEKSCFICPVCGQKTTGRCNDCGVSPYSSERDIEIARKKRELSPEEFRLWEEEERRQRAAAVAALKKQYFFIRQEEKHEIDIV